MKSPLHEVTGVIEAPADRVADLLLAARPGPIGPDNLWLLNGSHQGNLSGGPERFTAHFAGHTMTVEVRKNLLALQGGWWYRGEYLIEPHPLGTRLVHRVFNVAQRGRWGVPLANRFFIGFRAGLRKNTGDLLDRVGEQLGCAAHLE
ncbi:hypothetical protein FHR32_004609 [Streptosporangium album]|uniref:Polyketide cyclase / dehydrase and lipid transport n=1 Tax=Streptosporangium album TaxID=47479 RepID=A0A7W7WBK5_9ACTN|nr:hypothetical protein [Streptosporangium album]MBB4940304.1 hypothetical protein [Streptosporangium album]